MIIMVELMIAKKTKHTADERKIVPVGARKEERMHTYRSSNRTERVTAYYSCHDAIICMHHVSADSYDCRMSSIQNPSSPLAVPTLSYSIDPLSFSLKVKAL